MTATTFTPATTGRTPAAKGRTPATTGRTPAAKGRTPVSTTLPRPLASTLRAIRAFGAATVGVVLLGATPPPEAGVRGRPSVVRDPALRQQRDR
ncbi:hypothetical protein ACIGEZ_13025 [Streptomyces sp. NPDC085481]|uniref:hypothetical protein n=1 Tax=Streptomyces sp. NPDC085481 TaxID=3365727 RepID=UPI0037D07899